MMEYNKALPQDGNGFLLMYKLSNNGCRLWAAVYFYVFVCIINMVLQLLRIDASDLPSVCILQSRCFIMQSLFLRRRVISLILFDPIFQGIKKHNCGEIFLIKLIRIVLFIQCFLNYLHVE